MNQIFKNHPIIHQESFIKGKISTKSSRIPQNPQESLRIYKDPSEILHEESNINQISRSSQESIKNPSRILHQGSNIIKIFKNPHPGIPPLPHTCGIQENPENSGGLDPFKLDVITSSPSIANDAAPSRHHLLRFFFILYLFFFFYESIDNAKESPRIPAEESQSTS